MKTSALIVCIFLVASTAFSQLLLPKLTKKPTDLFLHNNDLHKFISGVLDGFALPVEFDDIRNCFPDSPEIKSHIINAMSLFHAKDSKLIKEGLQSLDLALNIIPSVMKACNLDERLVSTIQNILTSFSNPIEFDASAFRTLEINKIRIGDDLIKATNDFMKENFKSSGHEIGALISRVFYENLQVNDQQFLATLKKANPNMTWEAETYPQFDDMSLEEARKRFLGVRHQKVKNLPVADYDGLANGVPTSFDARTEWPNCTHAIRNQQQCGSCWAHAASEALSDRFCIFSNGTINKTYSVQYLVSCDTNELGCNGGYLDKTWSFLETNGDITDSCWTYQSGTGNVPECSSFTKCQDGTAIKKSYVKSGSSKWFTTPATIKAEIQANGPVETAFTVYQDFYNYKSGVYVYTYGSVVGGHAVKIVGWGVTTAGQNYWIVANSWGTSWGESGYFQIEQGQCGIDTDAIAGIPDLTRFYF